MSAHRTPINWDVEPWEHARILAIVRRAQSLSASFDGPDYQTHELLMDVTACHANGCQLQLDELLAAGDGDFAHDVFGIHRHIDRRTGTLTGCFLPRYAETGKVRP